jgi:hypothetical protein
VRSGMMSLVPTKFDSAVCALCRSAPASPMGEHAIPNWFRRDNSAGGGPYTAYVGGKVVTKQDGTPRKRTSYESVTLPVCDSNTGNGCNGALNTRFEDTARPVIRGSVYSELPLAAAETEAFGLWALKTSLLLAHPAAHYPEPEARPDPWDLGLIPGDIYGWMASGHAPPDSLSLWLTSPGRQTVGRLSEHLIPLPTVVAGGVTIGFQSFESAHRFGRAGLLRLSLVYHPGWPIENPLEAEGRAFRLWPLAPGACLDLAALPGVRYSELGWLGGWHLTFPEGAFPPRSVAPLSPATSLLGPGSGVVALGIPGEG